ncbi:hypothetical protein AAMO2058_001086600 [Amorphochlora amoebiformis]
MAALNPAIAQNMEDIEILKDKMARAEEDGNIDALFDLKTQIEDSEKRKTLNMGALGIKQQFVCNISGLSYFSTDNEERLRSLYEGRAWQAWKKVRDMFAILNRKPQKPGIPGYRHLNITYFEEIANKSMQRRQAIEDKPMWKEPAPCFEYQVEEMMKKREKARIEDLRYISQLSRHNVFNKIFSKYHLSTSEKLIHDALVKRGLHNCTYFCRERTKHENTQKTPTQAYKHGSGLNDHRSEERERERAGYYSRRNTRDRDTSRKRALRHRGNEERDRNRYRPRNRDKNDQHRVDSGWRESTRDVERGGTGGYARGRVG